MGWVRTVEFPSRAAEAAGMLSGGSVESMVGRAVGRGEVLQRRGAGTWRGGPGRGLLGATLTACLWIRGERGQKQSNEDFCFSGRVDGGVSYDMGKAEEETSLVGKNQAFCLGRVGEGEHPPLERTGQRRWEEASEVPAGSGGRSGSKVSSWDLQTSVDLEPGGRA